MRICRQGIDRMTCDEIARILKAIAEPTRLRLVCLLSRHDSICVCELTEIMELPQYHVSRHLGVLRNVGIVVDERDGARVNYRLVEDNELVRQVTEALASTMETCPRAAEDLERATAIAGKAAS